MNAQKSQKKKLRSLADDLVHYDLATMMDLARGDYDHSSSGGPRLLDQKEIAARFRKIRTPKKGPDGPA